jgi:hypothetical protein
VRSQTKTVYYCGHCRKHGLSRHAMEKHEQHCTLNPERVCRWVLYDYYSPRAEEKQTHTMPRALPRWLQILAPVTDEVIEKLREHTDGCPACMLAAIRQSGLDRITGFHYTCQWDFDKEMARYREEEREYWQREERHEIEATFY